jgi:hypothetical protein
LNESLQSPNWRAAFSKELREAAADPEVSWMDMLVNESYEVIDPADVASEREARNYALSLLWEQTFPGEPVPEL